jgi:hypothetical protein
VTSSQRSSVRRFGALSLDSLTLINIDDVARNALLFTLIVDGYDIDLIWNIFYHFKLDDSSLSLLIKQCGKLVSVSTNLDSWSTSPYSKFLRVCSRLTLSQLRDHWQQYALSRERLGNKTEVLCSAFTREFEAPLGARMKSGKASVNFTVSRSAGPFWMDASQVLDLGYKQYWRTGTVFQDPLDAKSAKFMNPTFVYSLTGEGCAVHYGSFPLQGFHLASAFASKPSKEVKIDDFISCAKMQFKQWCTSFRAAVSPASHETVTIRLFAGDALALCRTLYNCHVTSSTSASLSISMWSGIELNLDSGDYDPKQGSAAPTMFNVIDTSNIADHVGLLNVLIVAVPLLAHGPSSTLYTETLLAGSGDDSFIQRLCADIPAMALLLGITPTAYVSGFTSRSNVHEILLRRVLKAPQYQERIAWKAPYLGDPVALRECGDRALHCSFDPLALAKLLFDIHYHMFVDEDIANRLQTGTIGESIIHYHRGTFAALLGLVKARVVHTNWDRVMEHILDLLHADRRLILGSNNYQELCCQLHIRGTYSVDVLRLDQTIVDIDRSRGRFQGWQSVPPLICLILVVPRKMIKVLEDMKPEEIGSPMLQVNIRSSSFHNIFSSIHISFGAVSIKGSKGNARAILEEDKAGWSGSSPLIVSVWIPSFNLALDPLNTRVSFGIHSTPQAALLLSKRLGLHLELFTVSLMDSNTVHIVPEGPHRPTELSSLRASMPRLPGSSPHRVSVVLDNTKVSTLAVRQEIAEVATHDSTEIEQISPCIMKVSLGQLSKRFMYPFPIDGKRAKLRIARKSGWIEVRRPYAICHTYRTKIIAVAGDCASVNTSWPRWLHNQEFPGDIIWGCCTRSLEHAPSLSGTAANNSGGPSGQLRLD